MTRTLTVDLPAHNAYVEANADRVSVIGGEGLETLASDDTATYIRFDKTIASDGTEDTAFRVGRGGSMLGFGLWDKPAAATVTDVRFVARARLPFGGGGDVPAGTWTSSQTNLPVYRWPTMLLSYQGDPYIAPGGYNFSQIRTDGQWDDLVCSVQLQHYISGADYVIAGIGSPATGTYGLCPAVWIDPYYPDVHQPFVYNVAIDLAYLAIRITYTMPSEPAPLRLYPRNNATRLYPRRRTRRPGTF